MGKRSVFEGAGLVHDSEALLRWAEHDALQGSEVRVENSGEVTRGVARGIDAHGALLVETTAGVQRFISGEVSVRVER